MTIDLDELERLFAAATPGDWRTDELDQGAQIWCGSYYIGETRDYTGDDAALIVALRNSAPTLIATACRVEVLERENARLRSVADSFEIQGPDADNLLWLIMRPTGAVGGQALFNLGGPSRIAGQCASILEQSRRAALGEPQ